LLAKLGQKESFWKKSEIDPSVTTSTVGFDVGVLEINSRMLHFSDFAGQPEYVRFSPSPRFPPGF
jgi:hypothetical protein